MSHLTDFRLSLPSRERGLKSAGVADIVSDKIASLPSRERGLKSRACKDTSGCSTVAPFAGAWIEMGGSYNISSDKGKVAPFAGAWIEMLHNSAWRNTCVVAPFAGAWIEILVHYFILYNT